VDGEATPCRKMPCDDGCCCIWWRLLYPPAAAGEGGGGREQQGKAEKAGKAKSREQRGGGCLFGSLSLSSIYRWWLARVKRGL
jgi:hypothetical protein